MNVVSKACTLALLFCTFITFSQNNYEPGYFINNQGEKTDCLIKNIAWKNNPENFTYKATENTEQARGTLQDIAVFEVSGYKFIRFTVQMERTSKLISELNYDNRPKWKTETHFFRLLVEGPLSLYSYEDGNIIKYFISTPPHKEATQLLHMTYLVDSSVKENSTYKQQLFNLMKDKFDSKTFENLEYNKATLVKLFLAYNIQNGETFTNHTLKQNKSSFNLKISAGAALASLKLDTGTQISSSQPGLAYDTYNFESTPVVRVGFEAECILPFNNNKWALFTDPNIQFYKKEETTEIQTNNITKYQELKAQYTFLEIPLGARYYMFLNQKNKLFINAAYVLAIESGDNFIKRDRSNFKISNNSNFAIGMGYNTGRYSAELRYTLNRETINYFTAAAKYSSIGLVLCYRIFNNQSK